MTAHGTISRYKNNGCRCAKCRAAVAAYARKIRRDWQEFLNNNPVRDAARRRSRLHHSMKGETDVHG